MAQVDGKSDVFRGYIVDKQLSLLRPDSWQKTFNHFLVLHSIPPHPHYIIHIGKEKQSWSRRR